MNLSRVPVTVSKCVIYILARRKFSAQAALQDVAQPTSQTDRRGAGRNCAMRDRELTIYMRARARTRGAVQCG